jgi:hypothetical protein
MSVVSANDVQLNPVHGASASYPTATSLYKAATYIQLCNLNGRSFVEHWEDVQVTALYEACLAPIQNNYFVLSWFI